MKRFAVMMALAGFTVFGLGMAGTAEAACPTGYKQIGTSCVKTTTTTNTGIHDNPLAILAAQQAAQIKSQAAQQAAALQLQAEALATAGNVAGAAALKLQAANILAAAEQQAQQIVNAAQ